MAHRNFPRRYPRCRDALLLGSAVWLGLALHPRAAAAVTFIGQAQRLERVYAALLDLRPGEPPAARPVGTDAAAAGGMEAGLELIPVPAIDNHVGSKREPVNPPPVIPRVRARYEEFLGHSPFSVMGGVTWEPAIRVSGYTANWLGGEAALNLRLGALAAALRGYTLAAGVTGPITAQGAGDQFTMDSSGVDLRLGVATGAWRVYGGYGDGHLDARLDVKDDGSRIRERGGYLYRLAGLAYQGRGWLVTVEQEATEGYLRHVILAVSTRF